VLKNNIIIIIYPDKGYILFFFIPWLLNPYVKGIPNLGKEFPASSESLSYPTTPPVGDKHLPPRRGGGMLW
jgi:hypothetical protein